MSGKGREAKVGRAGREHFGLVLIPPKSGK